MEAQKSPKSIDMTEEKFWLMKQLKRQVRPLPNKLNPIVFTGVMRGGSNQT